MAATRTTVAGHSAGTKDFQHLKLDPDRESLTLLSILRSFDGPINEERAWAILYQSAKAALQCLSANSSSSSNTNNNNNQINANQQVQIVQQQLADLSVAAQNSQNATSPASTAATTAAAPAQSVESRTRFIEPDDTGQHIVRFNETLRCCVVSETSQLWIHRDGHVHSSSFRVPSHAVEAEGRTVASGQYQLVAGLGWALFEALDYGCKREEQNVLSPDLEQMIDLMTSADDDNNAVGESQSVEDEGIERDSDEILDDAHHHHHDDECVAQQPEAAALPHVSNESNDAILSLNQVMDRCRMQISSSASDVQADNHFRAVCRALVAETLEFSDFLVKVSSAPEEWHELRTKAELHHTPELTALHLADWAKLWVQVIRQLRNGVKLKASVVGESARKPIEYELTPYEMMMDDIRSRRYKLRQVMVDGNIPPRVKKDAHAVILEFIRSRPPLRKASERTLRPARRVSTPVELLMESIRKHDSRDLRPTRSLMRDRTEFSPTTWGAAAASKRKLLKADQFNPDADDDDDDDLLADVPPPSPPMNRYHPAQETSADSPQPSSSSSSSGEVSSTHANEARCRRDSIPQHRDPSPRRHSITVIPTQLTRTLSSSFVKSQSHNSQLSSYAQNQTNQPAPDPRIRLIPAHLTDGSLPCSGTSSSTSSISSVSLPSPPGSPMHPGACSHHLQDDFVRSEEFQQVVQGKLVTLEELVHMRRVLTAASLENLPLESSMKDDVINGKVCFVCRKTRFSVFGAWWHGCKLCRRTVCTKCCIKMRIPSDRFDTVTVSELSWPEKQQPPSYGNPTASSPSPSSSSSPAGSLFSGFQLKLPQFRLHSPAGGSCNSLAPPSPPASNSGPSSGAESTPSSPVLARRGSERRKNGVSHVAGRFVHQSLAQHQSLSASVTPVRTPERKTSAIEGYVCRDCQSLIEHITYNPVRTLHRPHQDHLQPPVVLEHCSLP